MAEKAKHIIPKKALYHAAFNWEHGYKQTITMNV